MATRNQGATGASRSEAGSADRCGSLERARPWIGPLAAPQAERPRATTPPLPAASQATTQQRPLRGLLAAQFLGAFNDNAWKMIVTFLAVGALVRSSALYDAETQRATTHAMVIFTLP